MGFNSGFKGLNPRTARFEVVTVEADFVCGILSLIK